jgi:hypothetical protein
LAALAFRRDCTQHVQDVAVLVDRTPQVIGDAVNLHEHLVEVPPVAGARAAPAQLVGLGLPALGAPPPDRLVTHRDTAYEHQLFDLTKAQREPKVQPHAVIDDLHRIAVALYDAAAVLTPPILPGSPRSPNVTVPDAAPAQ